MENNLKWLELLALPTRIRDSAWLFPSIESVHVLALVLVVGSIIAVDLRLLGLTDRERPFSELAAQMLPWTWTAFGLAVLSGLLMFSSKAVIYFGNFSFRLKMVCLLLAGINMMGFHVFGLKHIRVWDKSTPPVAARLAGATSLVLWTSIVGAGRWIGFTT